MSAKGKTPRQTFGQQGEEMAAAYLVRQGFVIEARNKRFSRAEIDIIAKYQERLLIFVEVKIRRNAAFGYPETFLSTVQQSNYHEAATAYIEEVGWEGPIRFDIIALHPQGGKLSLEHFEDAF